MRHIRMVSALGAVALGLTGVAAANNATAAPTADNSSTLTARAAKTTGAAKHYVVLADRDGSAKALATRLETKGATVTSVNEAVGMVTVTSTASNFAQDARAMDGVFGAADEGVVGRSPQPKKKDAVQRPGKGKDKAFGKGGPKKGHSAPG